MNLTADELFSLAVSNTNLKELSENQLINDRQGVCQNIKEIIARMDGCDDVSWCESCLATVNDTLNSAADFFIIRRQKAYGPLYRRPHPFASDELNIVMNSKLKEQAQALHEKGLK